MHSNREPDKLSAIIVDDELHGRENLKKICETYCPEIKILGLADSVIEAKQLVGIHNPEIVFLDINMPVLDGFDFIDDYTNPHFRVVFVTAHEEYGINAIKAGAVDYLLKPVDIKELKQTVKKLLLNKQKELKYEPLHEPNKLVLPAAHGFEVLIIEDIIRIEAEGSYSKVILNNGKNKIISRTLKDFEDTLPKTLFFRNHKSHLINLKCVKDYSTLSGNLVTMIDGSKVEISRRKTASFIHKMKSLLQVV